MGTYHFWVGSGQLPDWESVESPNEKSLIFPNLHYDSQSWPGFKSIQYKE